MASQGWSFEDDRQQEVALESRPTRVVAYAQAARTLLALGVPVVGAFGSQHHADAGADHAAVGLELPSVGAGDTLDPAQLSALNPDLVVGVTYAGETYGLSESAATSLNAVAPILLLGVADGRPLRSIITRFHDLASALSGEPSSDSEEVLTEALAQLGDQSATVVALSGGTETDAYVANPSYWPSLKLLADAGITFTPTPATGGWEVVKWTDLAARHPADIILYDQRPNSLPIERLATIPGWSDLHPTKILPWDPEPPLTYQSAATFAASLATL